MAYDWTPKREARLRKLWGSNLTGVQLSEAMGLSLSALNAKARELGLPNRTQARKERKLN